MCNAIIITIIIITVRLYLSRYNNNIIIVGEKIIYGKIQITCTFIHCHKTTCTFTLSMCGLMKLQERETMRNKMKRKRITEYVTYDFRASPIFGQV